MASTRLRYRFPPRQQAVVPVNRVAVVPERYWQIHMMLGYKRASRSTTDQHLSKQKSTMTCAPKALPSALGDVVNHSVIERAGAVFRLTIPWLGHPPAARAHTGGPDRTKEAMPDSEAGSIHTHSQSTTHNTAYIHPPPTGVATAAPPNVSL